MYKTYLYYKYFFVCDTQIFMNKKFEIGKADVIIEGTDVTIIATGHLVWIAIEAEEILAEKGISAEVINMATIKPLDAQAIIDSAKKTGCVVTAEEHQYNGGLGESVARVLGQNTPTPIEMVAVDDSFGESGTADQLMEKYGISTTGIVNSVEKVISRK